MVTPKIYMAKANSSEFNCQCPGCPNGAEKGRAFCHTHETKGCSIKSPESDWEPEYDPNVYNEDKAVRHSHNCYSYAMGVYNKKKIEECRNQNKCPFDSPGNKGGLPRLNSDNRKMCGEIVSRTMADIGEGAYLTDYTSKCRPGTSKVFVIVDEKNDFHYGRQDKLKPGDKHKNRWSHKSGARLAKDYDATGAPIYAPHLANWNFKKEYPQDTELNYQDFCSYMCVPRDREIVLAGGLRKTRRYKKRFTRFK